MRMYFKGALAIALSFSATACLDLNVVNENNPDIERALSEPADVEQVIASSFIIMHQTFNSTDISRPFTQLSDELTTTVTTRAILWAEEPRQPLNNDPNGDVVWIPRRSWDNFSECIANANDGLRALNKGMRILTLDAGASAVTDNTDRAYTFAKFMQGLCTGYLALMHDQVAIATEADNVQLGYADLIEWERDNMKDYKAMTAMAIKSLEESIARAEAAQPFNLPPTWINQKTYSKEELIQAAHTFIARLLVNSTRTPAERAAVDWNKVLHHTERGLTYDFGGTLQAGILNQSNWLGNLTSTGSGQFRVDNEYIGQADQAGNYKEWLDTPFDQRNPFFIVTTDRRVTAAPATTCTNPEPDQWVASTLTADNGKRGDQCSPSGAYFRNQNTLSNFSTARSTGYRAYYQWYRRANTAYGAFVSNTGHYTIMSADENRLLRAEAMLRLNRVAEAVALINVSRTRGVRIGTASSGNIASNLPPIPTTTSAATLVPTTAYTVAGRTYQSCVPRSHKDSTQCGNVWDALIWERKMEMMGQDPVRWLIDARSLGLLDEGTPIQWPIPGRYLVGLEIPVYTYGGKGLPGGAPAYSPAW
jgi:hypothetical protein